jgi:prevent-host-death family protein
MSMKQWPVQDAKNQLSRVIDLARTEGPQTITRHGQPVVVVVEAQEFKKLRSPKETPLAFFSRFKGLGPGLARSKDLPRTIEF